METQTQTVNKSRDMNILMLTGNLVADPESRTLSTGKNLTRFRIASNDRVSTNYFSVTTWGKLAELCAKYLRKGSGVTIQGTMKTSTYEAKDGGGKRYSFEIWADEVKFGNKPRGQAPADQTPIDSSEVPF